MTRTLILSFAVAALADGCSTPRAVETATPRQFSPPAVEPSGGAVPADAPRPAQAEPPGPLTLRRAFELADRFHPEVAVAMAQLEAARGRSQQAGLLPNPSVVGRMESAPIEGRTTGDAEYVAGITQRLPIGGRLSTASRAGRLEEERFERELAARRFQVHRRVQGAFAAALYLDEAIKVETRAVRIAESGLGATNARLAAGDALEEDVARAEIDLERARLELERAQSLREQAQAELRAAIGSPSLASAPLEGALDAALELPALESLSARLVNHPLMAAAEASVAVQNARLDLAEAQRIPDVNLDLFYRRLEISHTDAFDVGIAIPIPLFDRNRGGIREAQAALAAATAQVRSTRNELERDLRQAHARLASALADSRVLHEVILPRAEIVLRASEARHAAGDASLGDVLPVRREHTAIRLAHLESLRQVMEAWTALSAFLPRE